MIYFGLMINNCVIYGVFYSLDCVYWGLLLVVIESMRYNCLFVKGCFIGDLLYEYEYIEIKKVEGVDGEKLDGVEEENIVS